MNTIMVNSDGSCLEFGVDHGQADLFVMGIDMLHKTAVLHLKSRTVWACIGASKPVPAELNVISFESFDIGERISGGDSVLFLRGVTLLGEFPTTRATAKNTTIPLIKKLLKG